MAEPRWTPQPSTNIVVRDVFERDSDEDCTETLTPLAWALIALGGVLLILYLGFFCWRASMSRDPTNTDLGPLAFMAAISGMKNKNKTPKTANAPNGWVDDKARSSIGKGDPSSLWGWGGNPGSQVNGWPGARGASSAFNPNPSAAPPSYASSYGPAPTYQQPASGYNSSNYQYPGSQPGYSASAYSAGPASGYNPGGVSIAPPSEYQAYNNNQAQTAYSKWNQSQVRMGNTSSFY